MKMNFKYVSMMACAALMAAFTSCSNDDTDVDGLLPNGEMTTARFTLTQTGSATRAVDAAPTDDEKAVKSATLYVFDSSQLLEKVVPFTANTSTSPVVEITSGGHYFLAAVNAPAVTGITEGTSTLSAVEKTIVDVTLAGITGTNGFFMTNINGAVAKNLAANTDNDIEIKVGRAMAKVAVACTGAGNTTTLTGEKGKLTDVKFVTANNPKKMHYFPVIEESIYKAPYYANEAIDTDNYLPALAFGDTYTAISALSVAPGTDSYLIENANKVVRKGNMPYLLISGKYVPAAGENLKNSDNTAEATLPVDGTFYRLYNVDNDEYYEVYIIADNKAAIDPADFTDDVLPTTDPSGKGKGHVVNVIEYKEGVCYYAFALENKNNVAPTSKHTAKRNVYYDVTLSQVLDAGASVPNVNGNYGDGNTPKDEVVPGTGGGDGGGENNNDKDKGGIEEPVEGNCNIQGTITIEAWNVVDQPGIIG